MPSLNSASRAAEIGRRLIVSTESCSVSINGKAARSGFVGCSVNICNAIFPGPVSRPGFIELDWETWPDWARPDVAVPGHRFALLFTG